MLAICTCGNQSAHAVARRRTADDKIVLLWDDGSLTGALGTVIRGSANPRTEAQRTEARRVGWLVLGEVSLYDADEITPLIKAARALVRRDPGAHPGDLRAAMWRRREAAQLPSPTWEHPHPGVRTWSFSRLSPLAGLVIWHERGRYSVLRRERRAAAGRRFDEVLIDTGAHSTTVTGAYEAAIEMATIELAPYSATKVVAP